MSTGFRILDPFQVYTDLNGKLASGGTLHFYEAGTTTDADVYGDKALSTNNGATIDIGTDGRAEDDIWGDTSDSYRCKIFAADGTLIRDRDNLSAPGAGATTIPTLVSGDFLTNDGSVLSWAAIRQALDPAGAANKIMGSDGTNLVWIAKPSDGDAGADGTNANVIIDDSGVKWNNGSGDLFYRQIGIGTCAASGSHNASTSVTFTNSFKKLYGVQVQVTNKAASSNYNIIAEPVNASTTGFTADFNTNSSDGSNGNITNTIEFTWFADGTVASS